MVIEVFSMNMNYSKIVLGTVIGIVLLSNYSLSHSIMAQGVSHFLSNEQICHRPSTCIQIRQGAGQTDNNLRDMTFGNNSLSITFKNGTSVTLKNGSTTFDNR